MSANNTVLLVGRLTAEPKITHTTSEKSFTVASFTLAVDRGDKNKTADFINVKAIGNRADFVEKYVAKGTKIICKGSWQTGNYTNKEGQKVYTNEMMVEDISFAESKSSQNATASTNYNANTPDAGFKPIPDSELPDFMKVPMGDDGQLPFAPPTR